MSKIIDLDKHISITALPAIEKLIAPLRKAFQVTFFRYLKLYHDGKRVVFSNNPDALRYMYEHGNYQRLWYDGAFPHKLKPGWHNWEINRLLDPREITQDIDVDMDSILKVNHGITYISEGVNFYEIFSFDSPCRTIYEVEHQYFLHFIYYFKDQAKKIIEAGEKNILKLPIKTLIKEHPGNPELEEFLQSTKVNRFYINSKLGSAYLTTKEAACIRWLMIGKTAEEIGMIENISTKTVQRHIENIKQKFNCHKQTQLVQLLIDAHAGSKHIFI